MRKVIEQNPTQILVLCDDLELYGRDNVVDNLCESCEVYSMPEHANGVKELHCYGPVMMRQKMDEAKRSGYARKLN